MRSVVLLIGLTASTMVLSPERAKAESENGVALGSPMQLPQGVILAANFVREGRWYAMNARHIGSICRALQGIPFSAPRQTHVQLPPLPHRIILWMGREGSLVPADVVKCDDEMHMVFSTKHGRFYDLFRSGEQKELLRLLRTVQREGAIFDIGSLTNSLSTEAMGVTPTKNQ
jgi:hypothetical protein